MHLVAMDLRLPSTILVVALVAAVLCFVRRSSSKSAR